VTNASSHQRLAVAADKFERRIELYAGDTLQAELLLGTSPGLRQTHVRTPDSDAVFSAAVSTFEWPTDRAGWLDATGLAVTDVRALEHGGYRYERATDDWSVSGTGSGDSIALSAAGLETLVTRLAGIRVTGISDRARADIAAGAVTMRLETQDGALELALAAADDEFLLQRSDYATLFTLAAADYNALLAALDPDTAAAPTDAAAPATAVPDVHQSEAG
jgi:hypothetical protein